MRANKKIGPLQLTVLLLLLAIIAAVAAMAVILQTPRLQRKLVAYYAAGKGYQVGFDHLSLTLDGGLNIRAADLTVSGKNNANFFSAALLDLTFDQFALLKGSFSPSRLILSDPTVQWGTASLKTDRAHWKRSAVSPLIGSYLENIQLIRLINASVEIDTLPFSIAAMDLHLSPSMKKTAAYKLEISGKAKQSGRFSPFNIAGIIQPGTAEAPQPAYAINLSLQDLTLERLPWNSAFLINHGRANMHMALKGVLGQVIEARGSVNGQGINFVFKRGAREKTYHLPEADLSFDARLEKGVLHIATRGPKGPGFALSTQTIFDASVPQNPTLDLQIKSDPLSLATFKSLFPGPLLPQWLETKLFPIFSSGSAQLTGLRLKGSLTQISNLGRRENAAVLSLSLRIEDVNAFTAESSLPVSNLSGDIAFEKGQLLISEVKGRFGTSRLDELTLTFEDLYKSGQYFHFGVKGDFELEDLKTQASLEIVPRPIQKFFNRFKIAQGRLNCDSKWFFSPDAPYLKQISGRFELGAGRLLHQIMSAPILIEAARLAAPPQKQALLFLSARWRDSLFQVDSSIDLGGYLQKPDRLPSHTLALQGDLDIGDAIAFFREHLPTTAVATQADRISAASGEMQARMQMDYHAEGAEVAIKKLSLKLSQCRIALLHSVHPIDVASAEYNLDADGQMRMQGHGSWGPTQIVASGKSGPSFENFQVFVAGRISVADINRQFFPHIDLPVAAPSPTGIRLTIERAASVWRCQGQAFLKDHRVSIGSYTLLSNNPKDMAAFEVDVTDPGEVHIKRAQLYIGQSILSVQGRYAKGKNRRLNLDLAADHLQLKDFSPPALEQGLSFEGIVTGRASLSTDLAPPFNTELNGEIKARALSLSTPHLPAPITDGEVHLVMSQNSVRFTDGRMVVGNDPVFISGQLTGWHKWDGRIQIKADQVDITRWQFAQSRATTSPPPPKTLPAQIPINIAIAKVRYRSMLYGPLTVQCTYRQDGTSIDSGQLQLNPGILKISGQIEGQHSGADTLLSIYINTDKQPIGPLLELVKRKQKDYQLHGTLSLRGIGYLRAGGQQPFFNTLSGLFSFELKDGAVQNDLALLRILDLLSLQNIFLKRLPDLRKESFYFESIQGTVEAKEGRLAIDDMIMRSPVFNSASTGSIDLKEGTIDLNLGAQPLGTIDYLVSKIPIAGHILTGDDKTLLVYYFDIGGTFEKPTVKYTPFKNLDESILGYFKRTFFTPERIYKKIKNLTDDLLQYDHPPTADEIKRFERLQNQDIHK